MCRIHNVAGNGFSLGCLAEDFEVGMAATSCPPRKVMIFAVTAHLGNTDA